ncbi:MAG: hypothetical protein WCS99_17520 [Limisphaerales bacterium]
MSEDLYSTNVEVRYQATPQTQVLIERRWPRGCTGAGNAFLVLLGPSMGKEKPGESRAPGGDNRPYRDPMTMGRSVIDFMGLGGRGHRWNRLCKALLGEDRYTPALTALVNLDWSHETDEREVSPKHLVSGFHDHIWKLLIQLRPRIICALTRRVWDTVAPEVRQFEMADFPKCPIEPSEPRLRLPVAPMFIRIPGCDFVTMLIKPHNHPSRPYLGVRHIAVLGQVSTWFQSQPVSDK